VATIIKYPPKSTFEIEKLLNIKRKDLIVNFGIILKTRGTVKKETNLPIPFRVSCWSTDQKYDAQNKRYSMMGKSIITSKLSFTLFTIAYRKAKKTNTPRAILLGA
jgi:hypothetical protein